MHTAHLNRIATAVPGHDIHTAFVGFAEGMLEDLRARMLFRRMAARSGIQHRYSFLDPGHRIHRVTSCDAGSFYQPGAFPDVSRRMLFFELFAPILLHKVLDQLALTDDERAAVSHVIVTTCTGLYAPGLDFETVRYLNLSPGVERTMVGFMGCFAAINGLKLARHIVRSQPQAHVLLVNLELCTLHLQHTQDLQQILSFLLFADGAAASLISARRQGFALDRFATMTVPESEDLITWTVRSQGFDMALSGRVPGEVKTLLSQSPLFTNPRAVDLWAVHPGGRSILDAVEDGLQLSSYALAASRQVLADYGNMSSATVMFVLQILMAQATAGQQGRALSFGPGLTAETMLFHAV